MATGRKSSTSKGGGVHFPDETEDDVLSESGDDTQHDKIITAIAEPDGTYLVKAGFLKIQHKYEIIFLIPQVPTLGKDSMLSPALRATPKPRLRATHIVPCPEGGVKVVCEYSAQQEGVVQDELTLINRSRRDSSVKVRVHARVMGENQPESVSHVYKTAITARPCCWRECAVWELRRSRPKPTTERISEQLLCPYRSQQRGR